MLGKCKCVTFHHCNFSYAKKKRRAKNILTVFIQMSCNSVTNSNTSRNDVTM